ncbi:hypothetical protein PDE_05016 [Penicillium oxalicum 114-2]|uniref:FHA domain-containing protein n=1 Tax=Penicillium oxalicum (strain 114-2 / CGMCC 5302) TaxID=933388 RepID=S7ZMZ6_PENO1|nr:hypothetical protein PDE_05016 [Penicillium oxalicum 114-2]
MSEAQASVVLRLLGPRVDDTPLTRTFTLSSSNPSIEIGRSSKREGKRRTPAPDNGWFDSRVMSRDHAELALDSVVEKSIVLRDCGSTHGTWLNGFRLSSERDSPLLSGDVLRFGTDVDRGDEHFPALSVCFDVAWSLSSNDSDSDQLETEEVKEDEILEFQHIKSEPPVLSMSAPPSANTFCVPEAEDEDDDDDDEEDDDDDDDEEQGNENGEREDGNIGGTSCFVVRDNDKFALSNIRNLEGSQALHMDGNAPRSESLDPTPQEERPMKVFVEELFGGQGARPNDKESLEAQPGTACPRELTEDRVGKNGLQIDESCLIDYSEDEHDEFAPDFTDGDSVRSYTRSGSMCPGSRSDYDYNYRAPSPIKFAQREDVGSHSNSKRKKSHLLDYSADEFSSDEDSVVDSDDQSSVDQGDEGPDCIDPTVLTRDASTAPHAPDQVPHISSSGGLVVSPCIVPYRTGQVKPPWTDVLPPPVTFPLTPVTPKLNIKREDDDEPKHLESLRIHDLQTAYRDGPFARVHQAQMKKASADETAIAECFCSRSQKRKASEMAVADDQDVNTMMSSVGQQDLDLRSRSLAAEAISSALSEGSASPPPSKRAKAHHDSSSHHIGAYAATAVISAMLGGLGTIALLASLPAEYFQ